MSNDYCSFKVVILKVSVPADLATPVVTGGYSGLVFNNPGPRVQLEMTHA